MKIIVDAFGGDNAPLEILKGCQMAVEEYGVDILLTGSETIIRQTAQQEFPYLIWKFSMPPM